MVLSLKITSFQRSLSKTLSISSRREGISQTQGSHSLNLVNNTASQSYQLMISCNTNWVQLPQADCILSRSTMSINIQETMNLLAISHYSCRSNKSLRCLSRVSASKSISRGLTGDIFKRRTLTSTRSFTWASITPKKRLMHSIIAL